jgi:UDPglucose 6-dehydrogenase
MRDAPAINVIEALVGAGAQVHAYDPEATNEAKKIFGERVRYANRNYDALDGAAALLVLTEWNEFRRPDFARIKRLLQRPVIFDGRNIYDPLDLAARGFTYYSIGRNHG